jgi:hypothetical protein
MDHIYGFYTISNRRNWVWRIIQLYPDRLPRISLIIHDHGASKPWWMAASERKFIDVMMIINWMVKIILLYGQFTKAWHADLFDLFKRARATATMIFFVMSSSFHEQVPPPSPFLMLNPAFSKMDFMRICGRWPGRKHIPHHLPWDTRKKMD